MNLNSIRIHIRQNSPGIRDVFAVEFENDSVLGLIFCEIFTVVTLQDWVGWGIFTVIPRYPRRANGDSLHLEARPIITGLAPVRIIYRKELQDRALFEIIR